MLTLTDDVAPLEALLHLAHQRQQDRARTAAEQALRDERERQRRERTEIVEAARRFVRYAFPGSLGKVVHSDAWTGFAGDVDHGLRRPPLAAAHLGYGAWVLYERDGLSSLIHVLLDCACGHRRHWLRPRGDDHLLTYLATIGIHAPCPITAPRPTPQPAPTSPGR